MRMRPENWGRIIALIVPEALLLQTLYPSFTVNLYKKLSECVKLIAHQN